MKCSVSCILVLGLVAISQIMADPFVADPVDSLYVDSKNATNTTTTHLTTKPTKPTKPTTTATIPTTTVKPASTPRYSWKKEGTNTTCLLLQAKINILYNVTVNKKTKLVNITVPSDPEYDGKCTDDADALFLSWKDAVFTTYSLEMYFNKTTSDYHLSKVAVSYASIASSLSGSTTVNDFLTDLDTAYNCTKGVDISVGAFNVTMRDVRVQAFMDDKSDSPDFGKTGNDCASSGSKTDAIVPIAVGCALAAMVIIVLIGYCIGRRRTMAGYQQMSS